MLEPAGRTFLCVYVRPATRIRETDHSAGIQSKTSATQLTRLAMGLPGDAVIGV
jgi:hypothetical protein